MSKKKSNETIKCRHFKWVISIRSGVYQADGRGNTPCAGRHSLASRDYDEALSNLEILDERMAIKLGLLRPDQRTSRCDLEFELGLVDGVARYYEHLGRPRVAKGAGKSTIKRYRAVFSKALTYLKSVGIESWNQVNEGVLGKYLSWLDGEQYAYATEYFEGTVLKQANKYFVESQLLPQRCRIKMHLDRPSGTDTHCYTDDQVVAIIRHCRETDGLGWLADVVVGLSHTGMRISELSQLTWSAIDLERRLIVVRDESRSRRTNGRAIRTTKGRRDRRFPIHPTLMDVLTAMKQKGATGHVFAAAKGGILHDGNLRKILVEQVLHPLSERFPSEPGEIGFANGRLHSFRHYFCSWCANSGVSEQAVMDWLGHRDSTMVRHYYHLHDREAQQQMLKLGAIPGLDAS